MKESLLYLCHRIPYPPNKGDKIASFNILKFLSQHYDVYLGCYIDDPFDKQYIDVVKTFCEECTILNLSPTWCKIKSIRAFATGEAQSVPYYSNRNMSRWVTETLRKHSISKAFVFSSSMAQFVEDHNELSKRVIHFVDIDSDKWLQYSVRTKGVMSAIYRREYRTLARYEKQIASTFDVSCFVTPAETTMFQQMVDTQTAAKVFPLENGIDCEFFSNDITHRLAEPYDLDSQNYVVFTGAMDYWANVDAVQWFLDNVWPTVISSVPDAHFYIVGSSPTKQVQQFSQRTGITVTGRVEDVRPYLSHSKAAVAPMQIARGVQNKILEAMSMECPVVTTDLGIEGIDNYPTPEVTVTASAEVMAKWVIDKLSNEHQPACRSRQWLLDHYSWNAKLSPLLKFLDKSHV
ncbi:TIGR03087 family PEP-CTERM/XrtA system glycosyltransferase [Aliivibrio kagoshimensis]|uniref:TIGR03087 family PEP-CTERM/XrtA system glycosyltransferase n=1 Tax=Aliivibrio kagoshimensis TaxID=2910230 RepID=UPI003D0EAC9F